MAEKFVYSAELPRTAVTPTYQKHGCPQQRGPPVVLGVPPLHPLWDPRLCAARPLHQQDLGHQQVATKLPRREARALFQTPSRGRMLHVCKASDYPGRVPRPKAFLKPDLVLGAS